MSPDISLMNGTLNEIQKILEKKNKLADLVNYTDSKKKYRKYETLYLFQKEKLKLYISLFINLYPDNKDLLELEYMKESPCAIDHLQYLQDGEYKIKEFTYHNV